MYFRRAMVQNDAYDDLESHHTALEEIPEYVEGYLIRQREMPETGWGTWDGIFDNLEDQHLYENPGWVECWILVIRSRYPILDEGCGIGEWSGNQEYPSKI